MVRWFETCCSVSDKCLHIHDFTTGTVSNCIEGVDRKDTMELSGSASEKAECCDVPATLYHLFLSGCLYFPEPVLRQLPRFASQHYSIVADILNEYVWNQVA